MLCRLMHLSRSSFYFWLKALQTPCKQKQKLAETIREIIDLHDKYPSHGYRWLRAKLELDNKIHISDGYALKCCRMAGIQSQCRTIEGKPPTRLRGSFPPFRGTQKRRCEKIIHSAFISLASAGFHQLVTSDYRLVTIFTLRWWPLPVLPPVPLPAGDWPACGGPHSSGCS
jgi:hypothetical protein